MAKLAQTLSALAPVGPVQIIPDGANPQDFGPIASYQANQQALQQNAKTLLNSGFGGFMRNHPVASSAGLALGGAGLGALLGLLAKRQKNTQRDDYADYIGESPSDYNSGPSPLLTGLLGALAVPMIGQHMAKKGGQQILTNYLLQQQDQQNQLKMATEQLGKYGPGANLNYRNAQRGLLPSTISGVPVSEAEAKDVEGQVNAAQAGQANQPTQGLAEGSQAGQSAMDRLKQMLHAKSGLTGFGQSLGQEPQLDTSESANPNQVLQAQIAQATQSQQPLRTPQYADPTITNNQITQAGENARAGFNNADDFAKVGPEIIKLMAEAKQAEATGRHQEAQAKLAEIDALTRNAMNQSIINRNNRPPAGGSDSLSPTEAALRLLGPQGFAEGLRMQYGLAPKPMTTSEMLDEAKLQGQAAETNPEFFGFGGGATSKAKAAQAALQHLQSLRAGQRPQSAAPGARLNLPAGSAPTVHGFKIK